MKYYLFSLLFLVLFLSSCSLNNNSNATIIFTFDDATLDQFEVAYPILNNYNYPATLFVITSLVNSSFEYYPLMSWNQIKILSDNSWDIQSHSYSHPFLTSLNESDLIFELSQSKNDLESQGYNSTILAFPYGDFNDSVLSLANNYYDYARPSIQGYNKNISDASLLRSQWTMSNTTFEEMKFWLDNSIENNYTLIVMVHRVSYNSSDDYSVKPDVLKDFVNYVHKKRVPVKTLSEVVY